MLTTPFHASERFASALFHTLRAQCSLLRSHASPTLCSYNSGITCNYLMKGAYASPTNVIDCYLRNTSSGAAGARGGLRRHALRCLHVYVICFKRVMEYV